MNIKKKILTFSHFSPFLILTNKPTGINIHTSSNEVEVHRRKERGAEGGSELSSPYWLFLPSAPLCI